MAAAGAAGGVPQFASLYVGDLHPDVTEAMLYEIFNSVGPVASIRVCRDSITRRSLGYAYVNFHGVSDAERALDTLNYSSIKGRACRIMWSQRDPSLRKSGLGNVYVKNLDKNIDNKALYDTFSLFGNILSCKVSTDPQGKSFGYGFVHYETEEAAKQAIERVNGMQIGEKTVHVSGFEKRGDRSSPEIVNFTNLYVKGFPEEWDEPKIKEIFSPFGEVTSIVVLSDKKSRKFAFVNYETTEGAHAAIEGLHEKDVRTDEQKEKDKADEKAEDDCKMYVQRHQTKFERSRELKDKFPQAEKSAPSRAQGVNLYIKNLDEETNNDSLKELFSPFGTVTSVAAMMDDKSRCKGFGFISFASPDEATKAVTEMHLKVVKGKPLYVGLAEKREARQERLRERYSATGPAGGAGMMGGPMGGKGGWDSGKGGGGFKGGMMKGGKDGMKGGDMMMGGGMKGGMPPQMMGGMPPQMGMMKGGMPPQQQQQQQMMMQQQQQQQMMMMQMKGGMPGMNPQMMQMKGGMPGMMGGKPGMPMGPMGGMPGMNPMAGKGMPGMPGMPGGMPGMMGKGMPGMMPQGQKGGPMPMPQQQPPQQQQQQQPAQGPSGGLSSAALAAAPPAVQKQMVGEKLYPAIAKFQPELAGKITGMMLEMDNSELIGLLQSDEQLKVKVDEAMRVLESQRA